MEPTPPGRPLRRRQRHVAARSRAGVAVGSVAACVALVGGFAHQNLGALASASSPTTATPQQPGDNSSVDGYAYQDDAVPADPLTNPGAPTPNGDGFGRASGSGAVPGQLGGGANTTSGGS